MYTNSLKTVNLRICGFFLLLSNISDEFETMNGSKMEWHGNEEVSIIETSLPYVEATCSSSRKYRKIMPLSSDSDSEKNVKQCHCVMCKHAAYKLHGNYSHYATWIMFIKSS